MRTRATAGVTACLLLLALLSLVPFPVSATVSLGGWIQHSPDDISGFTPLTGDEATASVTLPFTFTIEGTSYTTLVLSTNGWIEFGTNTEGTPHPTNACLPTGTHTNPFLAAYWDDLNPFGISIRYGTVGTSPNRVFIADYEVDLTSGSEGSDDLRFQVQLHERSNVITVRYRDQQSATNGISATIGFQGAGGASATTVQPLTCNGKVLDDNRSDEGWSADVGRSGLVTIAALMAHSPDDLAGFTTLTGNDAIAGVTLPFSVTLEGTSYSTVTIGTNGLIQFGTTTGANPSGNASLPSSNFPNPTLFYYWDDLQTEGGNIRYATVGTSPNRTFIVDFQENLVASSGDKVNGQVQIHERSSLINVKYRSTLSNPANGQSATIGFQGAGGSGATAYPLTLNGKILDDDRPDEGWSVHPKSLGAMSLHAFVESSPNDISGFTTLSGNDVIAGVTLPFSVNIDGTSYGTVTIGTNGLIQFGTTTGANPTGNASLPSASFPNPTIFYYWDDLQTEGGNIRYGTVGTSPHRTFIVDFQENLVASSGDKVNGQVQIHEGSNLFNVQYRSTMSANANGQSATIGFQGAGGASATAYPLTFNGKILDDNLPNAGWSVSPLPICGNSVTETKEQCDDGGANGTLASCCTSTCGFKTTGTACTDDGNVCTNDQCNGASAVCQHPNNSAPCNDLLFCNGTDTCGGGSCSIHSGDPCPGADGDANCAESCDEAGDTCTAPDTNGSACTGNGAGECSLADTCQAGLCQNNDVAAGTSCTDASPPSTGNCLDAQCNGTGICDQNFANEINGTSCNDGAFCNGTDSCNAGTCTVHTGDPCPGADGDGNCSESCNEAADNCTSPDPNGSACDDSLFCNGTDTCSSGSCATHSGDPCPGADGDGNCAESCDESADNCSGNDLDGSTCDDSLFCNGTDTCSSGSCTTHTGDPCPGPDGDVNCAESCDEAADNCSANDVDGSTCRPATGLCDATETCSAGACPSDAFEPSGTVCNAGSGDLCDPDEVCDGSTASCPADTVAPGGTVCNPGSGDLCDPDETCSGIADQPCPTDTVAAGGTVCNPGSGDLCDPDETCSGTADQACPADTVAPATTECRGPAAECDLAENCTGTADQACPPDVFQPNTVECRSVTTGDVCDEAEYCTGSGPACPADLVKPNTEECRPSAGVCDTADLCDGVSKTCPADAKEPVTTECRASVGVCDVAENCDGASDVCPADQFQPNTVSCRGTSTGELCDEEELCTGSGPSCPADGVKASGVGCRSAIDLCDASETCDGSSKVCPPDGVQTSGTPCRAAAGACDVAETCDGSSTACPVDGFQASGTACGSNANTDCDNPDTCNGTGTCLTNNEANGTSCDDGSSCTTGEACQGGVCSGGVANCPLDHYKCYQGKDLKNPKFTKWLGINTTDQLVTEKVDAKKLKFVCTPVDKNGEGINDPNAHLACYQLKAPTFGVRPNVEVSTQFQTSHFQIKKGKLLCLPATKTVLP